MSEPAGEVRLEVGVTWDGRPVGPEERVRMTLARGGGELVVRIDAPLHGDPPPAAPPGPTPGLWEHEVVELFVAAHGPADGVEYTEVEVAPGGHYLVLRFRGVRRLHAEGPELALEVATAPGRWRAEARLPLAALPEPPWRVAAFALHGAAGSRRHLASVALPGPRPDFHQPHRFPAVAMLWETTAAGTP